MSAFFEERVLDVHHWTDTLMSITTTRDPALRFRNGEFAMIGLMVDGRPLLRAYSMASANWEETLEFFSIKVPNGPLTSRLQHIAVGDTLLVGKKPTGTLVLDYLTPGKRLYFLATGTGLAPFLSLMKDPDAYERFETVVVTHGVRTVAELAYQKRILEELPHHEVLGELIGDKLRYYPTVTREPFVRQGRLPALIRSGQMARELGLPPLNPDEDRVMICGGPDMLVDCRALVEELGFVEGNTTTPGTYVIEKAFVEK
jgi:ferredoxin/flavodoxin---NADP+ reductase